jgi:hypothetical protein
MDAEREAEIILGVIGSAEFLLYEPGGESLGSIEARKSVAASNGGVRELRTYSCQLSNCQ